ncbi:cytochrome P450 81Q32-like [Rutidosis leptorrhynchoides]|uniref:cytochrome P450 81Q32-like n=1 Tax=Rutidosis leptorrhynchoides TaxID=125765 RepID=UPI003A99728A
MLPQKQPKNLPPSPPSIPILGHLHHMKVLLHQILYSLSPNLTAPSSLSTSPPAKWSSSRRPKWPRTAAVRTASSLPTAPPPSPVGTLGTTTRTLSSPPTANNGAISAAFAPLRSFPQPVSTRFCPFGGMKSSDSCLISTSSSGDDFTKVELKPMFLEMTFNIVVRMLTGKNYFAEDVTNAKEATVLREVMSEIIEYVFCAYPGDYLSILRNSPKKAGREERRETVLYHLLSLQEKQTEFHTDEIIKDLIMGLAKALNGKNKLLET